MRRSALVLAIVSCLALVGLSAVSEANTKKYATKISKVSREFVPGKGYIYSGHLSSKNKDCVKKRTVSVLVNVVENSVEDKTDSKGNWEILSTFGKPTETFVTVASGKEVDCGKGLCKTAQSSTTFSDDIEPQPR